MSSKSKEFPDKVLQRFREMTDNEFYEFFYQLARERRKNPDPGGEPEVRIVLAEAVRYKANEHAEPEPWRFSFIATAAPQYEKWNLSDTDLCQYGTCAQCGNKMASWVKTAVCPLCDATVNLT